jgi:hypothetical protein
MLTQVVTYDAKADEPLEIIGIYINSNKHWVSFPEIILYKQDNKIAGTWSEGLNNQDVYPLENINLLPNGNLTFDVPKYIFSRFEGRERQYYNFKGQLLPDSIQGSFIPNGYFLNPGIVKAPKISTANFKPNAYDYVLAKQKSASIYIDELNNVIKCQNQRSHLPNETITILGFWSKVESDDGLHERGYDVVLFKVGNTLHGWLEDYEGFLGDGGTKFIISDIQFDNKNLSFIPSYAGKFEGVVKDSQLKLQNSFGEVMLLNKIKKRDLPTASSIWTQYQMLRVDCK